ncbi:EAL domain-containing protein [Acetobacterium paludosum]|uniref:EAL domain-containing protein n=1 Tax=Acetobacterium paludosum TaxID=52693 RepID=A0A923KQK9_9FIRM|nr:EAL domain-containing protein [Acetobacterium paludosum]MBC3889249.1 EAL domain-containing protein [Acetobacterium paludosum]
MKAKFSITKISIISILVVALFFGASYYYTAVINRELKAETLLYLSEVGNQGVELVESKTNNQIENLKITARMIQASGNFDQAQMVNLIKLQAQKSDYKRMAIALPNGAVMTTDGIESSISGRVYFQEALAGKSVVSETITDYIDGKKINAYATPIFNGNDVAAVLVATVETESFKEFLGVDTFNNQGYSFIVKANGDEVVGSLHPNSVGDFDNMFDVLGKAEFSGGDSLETLKAKMEKGESGSYISKYNGLERYTVYEPLTISDWYMMTVVPTRVVNVQTMKILESASFLIVIALIAISLLFLIILIFQNRSKNKLAKIAFEDEVTGGNNWQKFKLEATEMLGKKDQRSYVLLTFDIDQFRFINEAYGLDRGNELLKLIMDILKANLGKNETCARVSADHFVIFCGGPSHGKITQRIRNFICILNAEKEVLKIKEKIVCHFGIYIIENETKDLEKIREKANMARIAAKRSENGTWFFYSDAFRKIIEDEKEIIDSMDEALNNNEFEMYLQPKYNLHTDEFCGCEALVRWNHPQKGLRSPGEFIPIFEQTGFIRKLDMFMIKAACKILKHWEENGFPEMTVSVNISRKNLHQSDFTQKVLKITDDYCIKKHCLEMEITESVIFEDLERMIEVGKNFRDDGFKISMDDFGSGYSSINLLETLPLDTIKIDQGFFKDNLKNERTQIVVKAMIELIKQLGMTVVAEGIETKEEVDILRKLNCDIIQGYYYGKPMTVDDFEETVFKK